MSLFDRYEKEKPFGIDQNMTVIRSYKDQDFPGNEQGTCAGQVLMWFMGLAGQIPTGTGLKRPLLTPQQHATTLQFDGLKNGSAVYPAATRTVDLRQRNTPKLLNENTPYTGKYKMYVIASDKGHGHAIGAYFPWMDPIQFYDPNLVHGKIKSDGSIYEILSLWVRLYQGVGSQDALWGHETLCVFDDPKAALKKIGA